MIENLDRQLAALDPEAGRCWRTDGEKWDLMAGQKCFEGDMHRGPERFKKACGNITGWRETQPICIENKGRTGHCRYIKVTEWSNSVRSVGNLTSFHPGYASR